MEFSEVNNTYHTFDEFVTIREAKELGIIPKQYVDPDNPEGGIFPDRCQCGSENIITRSLTRATCCNPRCKIKLGYALSELFTRFGIKGVGDQICLKLINAVYDKLEYKSHIEVLTMERADYPMFIASTMAGCDLYTACHEIRKEQLTFASMVSKLGLPELSTSTEKLLFRINCFSQLYEQIQKEGGVKNYCWNRNVYDANKIYWFYESLPDILLAEKVFCRSLRKEGLRSISICVTGSVSVGGLSMTRKEFINRCNQEARDNKGNQILEIKDTSAKESCSYVVADYPSTSSKYLAGAKRGVLITADNFIKRIQEVVKQCEEAQSTEEIRDTIMAMNLF